MKVHVKKTSIKAVIFIVVILLAALIAVNVLASETHSAGASMNLSDNGKFYSDYNSLEETEAAAAEVNIELAEDGFVLLKNQNNVLPFAGDVKRLSVFGQSSVNLTYGGGGSGGGDSEGASTVKDSLEAAGYIVNPALISFYEKFGFQKLLVEGDFMNIYMPSEHPVSDYDRVKGSYGMYNDAALVVLSRSGSEDEDLMAYFDDDVDEDVRGGHFLMLSKSEKALVDEVKSQFDKTIIIINSSNPMELGELENDSEIDGIIWIGHVGTNGIMALGEILNGSVNPSGKTADIYAADFRNDPTFINFGNNGQNGYEDTENTIPYSLTYGHKDENGDAVLNEDGELDFFFSEGIEYREGIYVGYRYYETAAYEADNGNYAGFDYDDEVVYPFGYGLSYTEFSWTLKSHTPASGVIAKNDSISVTIDVKNTGNVAGKDVVQVYYTPEYQTGKVEKSYVNLVTFSKTKLLQPGETQTLKLEFDAFDMASFDYLGKNTAGFKGYVLESGTYDIKLQTDSHNLKTADSLVTFTVDSDITYTNDPDSGGEIKTWLSNGDEYDSRSENFSEMSRSNFEDTFPKPLKQSERMFSEQRYSDTNKYQNFFVDSVWDPSLDSPTDPWYKTESQIPAIWTQGSSETSHKLSDMSGLSYNDPKWDEILNQLTWQEITDFINGGSNRATQPIASIGKHRTIDEDGPGQFNGNFFWVSEVVISSTWNIVLAQKQGQIVGNEGLWTGASGWYGPGLNTHRSPFGGRNFEYYSQDGVHGGQIAAAVIRGAQSKGLNCYAKHMALNDQETGRITGFVFASEQACREIYFRSFEYAAKDGNSSGFMTALTKIGIIQAGVHYNFLTGIVYNEWGFDGAMVTDAWISEDLDLMLRAGCQLPLGSAAGSSVLCGDWNAAKRDGKGCVTYTFTDEKGITKTIDSPTTYYAARESIHRVLYVAANTATNQNGIDFSSWYKTTKLPDAAQNVNYEASVADENNDFGTIDMTYKVADGSSLPEGLTLSPDGVITGQPNVAIGTYSFAIVAYADTWINSDFERTEANGDDFVATFTISVNKPFTYSGKMIADLGEDYAATLSSDFVKLYEIEAFEYYCYNSLEYSISSGELPDGLELSDGKIVGAPAATGTFDFTVKLTETITEEIVGFGDDIMTFLSYNYYYVDYTLTIDSCSVTFDNNYLGAEKADVVELISGMKASKPAEPRREGYTFTGWYTDEACSELYDFSTEVTGKLTLYAGWDSNFAPQILAAHTLALIGLIVGITGLAAAVIAAVIAVRKKK